MGFISRLKSCHDVRDAASNNIGGRKTRKTISGFNSRSGKKGTNPTTSPTITNIIGYGNFIFSATADSAISIVMKKMTISKFSILVKIVDEKLCVG